MKTVGSQMTLKLCAAFLLPAFLLAGCQINNSFTHKQFQERAARIHTVALVSQCHTALFNTYLGFDPVPTPLPNEPQIRSELLASTMDQLQWRGFTVMEKPTSQSTNEIWSGRMVQRLVPLPSTGISNAVALAAGMHADGLVFLDVTAYQSTQHRQDITTPENIVWITLDLAAAAGGSVGSFIYRPWQGATVAISLVDSSTGDVLWNNWESFDNFEITKPSKAVDDIFSRYPKHDE
jgi:hypothetical protein